MLFDGKDFPGKTSFTVFNVSSKTNYRFKVRAVNFNGYGPFSNVTTLNTCTSPGFIAPPRIVSISTNQVQVNWTSPASDGGCLITGYEL